MNMILQCLYMLNLTPEMKVMPQINNKKHKNNIRGVGDIYLRMTKSGGNVVNMWKMLYHLMLRC